MSITKLAHDFQKEVKGKVILNELMSRHTTWHIGGPADLLFNPQDIDDLKKALIFAGNNNLEITIVGAGSNILVKDTGIRGLVICVNSLNKWKMENNYLVVEPGLTLPFMSYIAAKEGLAGLEFASGIPGSIGGAVLMNAGAHGRQMSDVVKGINVMDYTGKIISLANKDIGFDYRSTKLKNKTCIITSIKLRLEKDDPEKVKENMNIYQEFRRNKQPINYPNAGSVFKNPDGDSAGRIIDSIGAKGWKIGGAMVSPKHANFIVNTGNAKCSDVLELIEKIKQKAKEENNLILEPEIIVLGG
ncbi:UDP-N-acetylmuramate dehydrogenase [Desulfonispora thiosulfatigenes DSM 11270]|uniref:UDP-N-acetylenolpyruvoylglucosamine reductase n=1 Tax=Desulfonispora thiosulfatigenes DSM 11270 TaxID=656914 RepID=A0A1W1VSS1_DESTI|nr:UDP-N-acetylmuramate dehydrogenase [Desulfonispora thiosulfatigenes]SMB96422.1 UDP-N-acetylmuramate dehydrogenase [Desulfonispora thiosulfatigenes DSM 11270]